MSKRLKILACGQVRRIEDHILDEMQVQVLDTDTKQYYNIFCHLVGETEDGDTYEINVCKVPDDDIDKAIDTCRMDSSGGIFMDEDFSYAEIDEDLGSEIIDLITDYFIVPF